MIRLNTVKADIRAAREKLAARIGQRDLILKERDQAQIRSLEASKQLGVNDQVQILLQKSSEYARQQVKGRVEQIVTQALQVVFPERGYAFHIVLDVKGLQPIAEYWLYSEGVMRQMVGPDYGRGGGAVDVVTLALRLALAELEQIDGPLLMDEVGKHVSAEFAPNVAFFLKEYSKQLGRQIILITHNEHLAAVGDRSLRVSQKRNGESEVRAI
ncbi:chromosome partitioning protein ParA [Paenibacillus sp. BK720]|uniref:chromosome partitioning protein ParA n=1 Tax=Paenibacillus sp. BK720 TaxID=2587092 RepID=UPI00141DD7D2|nr:chromosome partitioning protein ParA [Paenibacillus sp. BK720]NIK67900.1 putative ABC-type transport system involved in lysophospholipase L1 biosynthesis ATPase subunit [Paenibacillus sp. BK720]